MGGICARRTQGTAFSQVDPEVKWRVEEGSAGRKVRLDPSMPFIEDEDRITLYGLLCEPVSQRALGHYAKLYNYENLLMCWADIEEFKAAEVREIKCQLVAELCHEYIGDSAPFRLESLSDEMVQMYECCSIGSQNYEAQVDDDSIFAEVCMFPIR